MKKYLTRTRLAKDIVCEVSFPEHQTGQVALVCGGAPGTPPSKKILNFLAGQGYVAFGIRYRGTWESDGAFLSHSPVKDVTDVIDHLIRTKSILDTWNNESIKFSIKHIDLFGASFGGAAVLLSSNHRQVRRVVAIAPVLDFTKTGEGESFQEFIDFTEAAFGGAYRLQSKKDWQKLLQPHFYNPATMLNEVNYSKCFIIQAKDDDVCPASNVESLLKQIPLKVYFKPKGGHLGTSHITQKFFWKKIQAFLSK